MGFDFTGPYIKTPPTQSSNNRKQSYAQISARGSGFISKRKLTDNNRTFLGSIGLTLRT